MTHAALIDVLADRIVAKRPGDVAPESIVKQVPESLQEHQIFQDPKAAALWGKLSKAAKLSDGPWENLGSGTRGTAFGAGSLVLKITNDRSEAVAGALVRDNQDTHKNVYRVYSVWRLVGQQSQAFALVQERLEPLGEKDPWGKFADWWPEWTRENDYAAITPANATTFLSDCESSGLVDAADESWLAFSTWFGEVSRYFEQIGIQYHDFWHRNLLVRKSEDKPDQHVIIDLGYSTSLAKTPDIAVIAKFREIARTR